MYDLIDDLVLCIKDQDVYKEYIEASLLLDKYEVKELLSRQMMLQDEYMRLKALSSYVCIDDTRNKLLEVKNEVLAHRDIQEYYKAYYALNDLLDEVTELVFNDISDELVLSKWKC